MLIFKKFITSLLLLFVLNSALNSCNEVETDNYCKCWDNSGTLVLDTTYHMEYDQAYQLCEGKEGTQNYTSCECGEL